MTSSTKWWCEHCHASGVIHYEKQAGIYEVIDLLRCAHNQHALAEHDCDLSKVRVELIAAPQDPTS